jgi:type I restriction enzyme, S subunit
VSPDFQDKIFIVSQGKIERFDVEYYIKTNRLNLSFKYESIDIWNLENIEVRKWIFSLSPENYKTEWIPFLRVADLKWWTIVKDSLVYINEEINEKEKNTQLLPWDLVFSKVWTIDEVSMLPNDFKVYNMSQNIIWVKIRDNKFITAEYVRQLFQLDIWKKQLLANSMSWVQPKITLDSIRNIKIPLPPLEIKIK